MAIRKNMLLYAQRLSKESTAFRNFSRGINTDSTLTGYTNYLMNFMEMHKCGEDYDGVISRETKEIDIMITDYLDTLHKRGVKGITQRAHLMAIERLFIMNDVIFHKDRIRRGIKKDDEIPGGTVPITTEELWMMLSCTKSIRTKCIIHFLADTGMRPAGLSDPILRRKHLEPIKSPEGEKCYSLKIYDGSKSGYWAFLTPETTQILDAYFEQRTTQGEELTQESPIFVNKRKTSKFAENVTDDYARYIIYNMITASGIKRTRVSKYRFDKSAMYMFRKRFNTILKLNNDVNSNIAEKLMAHKRGLDGTYLQPTMEECFVEFAKAIPQLTIDPTNRQKAELAKQEKEIGLLEQKNKKIDELEKMVIELKEKRSIKPDTATEELILKILQDKKIIVN
jgi:integrase/recombinase XerD